MSRNGKCVTFHEEGKEFQWYIASRHVYHGDYVVSTVAYNLKQARSHARGYLYVATA